MTTTNKESSEYHYGLSGQVIWLSHILLGIFYVYLGYLIVEQKQILNKYYGVVLIVLGVLSSLYHAHLWYNEGKIQQKVEKYRGRERDEEREKQNEGGGETDEIIDELDEEEE
jgi:hypothetical protein